MNEPAITIRWSSSSTTGCLPRLSRCPVSVRACLGLRLIRNIGLQGARPGVRCLCIPLGTLRQALGLFGSDLDTQESPYQSRDHAERRGRDRDRGRRVASFAKKDQGNHGKAEDQHNPDCDRYQAVAGTDPGSARALARVWMCWRHRSRRKVGWLPRPGWIAPPPVELVTMAPLKISPVVGNAQTRGNAFQRLSL